MQGTLMGADKEWIYSFSTWDYLLPGGTQLASEWHARLCQQSAESAPLHRKAKSLPSPWWVPHPGCQHQAAQGTEHKPTASLQGKGPDTLLALPPPPSWFLILMCAVLAFIKCRMLAQLFFFHLGKKPKRFTYSPVCYEKPITSNQQAQPSLSEECQLLLQSCPCHPNPAVLTPSLETRVL